MAKILEGLPDEPEARKKSKSGEGFFFLFLISGETALI